MIKFNTINVLYVCLFLNLVIKCRARQKSYSCPPLTVANGRVRLLFHGTGARITCYSGFRLVRGSYRMQCNGETWSGEHPVCERNSDIQLSCDFESLDDRTCGWKNDNLNDVDWIADRDSYELSKYTSSHIPPGSAQYFSGNYMSLNVGDHGSNTFGKLVSPQIQPLGARQTCLIFSYKVTTGRSHGPPKLTVFFGKIPLWEASSGEGRAIIGLYKLNDVSNIVIQGKSCKAAIDNILVMEGLGCIQLPYVEEEGSCHDHCGIDSSHSGCSCSWNCFDNGDCCDDMEKHCPYIKSPKEMAKLYFTTTTITPITTKTTTTATTTTYYTNTTQSIKITTSAINYTSNSVRVPTSRNLDNVNATTKYPHTMYFTLSPTTLNVPIKSSMAIPNTTKSISQSNLITKSLMEFNHTTTSTIKPYIIQSINSTKLINTQNETIKPEVRIHHSETIMPTITTIPNKTTAAHTTTPVTKLINPSFITTDTKSKVLITSGLSNTTPSTQSSNILVKNNNSTNGVPNLTTYNTNFSILSTTYTTITTPITINSSTKKPISNPIASNTTTYSREIDESKNTEFSNNTKINENNFYNYINLTTIGISVVILAVILISFKYTLPHLRYPSVQRTERLIEMDSESYRHVELE